MRFFNRLQSIIIQGSSAHDFQTKLNRALDQIAAQGVTPEVTFPPAPEFCAYLMFETSGRVPETISEAYEERGLGATCAECPSFRPSLDGRVKYTTCAHGEKNTHRHQAACDWFYTTYRGAEPVEDRDERDEEPESQNLRCLRA